MNYDRKHNPYTGPIAQRFSISPDLLKNILIGAGVVLALALVFLAAVYWTNNTAIGYEESIMEAKAGITIQEKRQVDLITKLVQVVEAESRFEGETLEKIVQARAALKTGQIDQAAFAVSAVAEDYPDLRTNESYMQLMTELAVSENLKAQYRSTLNQNILEYKRFVRRPPADTFLKWTGYEVLDFEYLSFSEQELPEQLFNNP